MENSEINEKLEELKIIEMNLQNIIMQKQSREIELNEIENALSELDDYDEEVYKIVSQIMIKTDRAEIVKELEEKKEMIDVKVENLERQEELLEKKVKELQKEISEFKK